MDLDRRPVQSRYRVSRVQPMAYSLDDADHPEGNIWSMVKSKIFNEIDTTPSSIAIARRKMTEGIMRYNDLQLHYADGRAIDDDMAAYDMAYYDAAKYNWWGDDIERSNRTIINKARNIVYRNIMSKLMYARSDYDDDDGAIQQNIPLKMKILGSYLGAIYSYCMENSVDLVYCTRELDELLNRKSLALGLDLDRDSIMSIRHNVIALNRKIARSRAQQGAQVQELDRNPRKRRHF